MTTLVQGEVARSARVVLREKRLGDARDDYRWRSDSELSRYDAARPLTMSYQEFLAIYRDEMVYPSSHRRSLAIEDETGRHIGNVMYYNVETMRRQAELGITIGEREYWGRGYGVEAVRLLVEHLLGKMRLRRVHLKTLTWNERAHHCFEKAGFVECGRARRSGYDFILMEFSREWRPAPGEPAGGREDCPRTGA
jgi:RimJ/RimL family protein N-acetyltransferase